MQVSRLGNPLFNEVIVPMCVEGPWNKEAPADDKNFAEFVAHPELANLFPVVYPGVFPNLAALDAAHTPRADLRRDPAHRHPETESSPGSPETSPARPRPTCCDST